VAGRRPRLSVLLADKSALEWARRDKRARAAFLSLRTAAPVRSRPRMTTRTSRTKAARHDGNP
jgi:hypothetical protein